MGKPRARATAKTLGARRARPIENLSSPDDVMHAGRRTRSRIEDSPQPSHESQSPAEDRNRGEISNRLDVRPSRMHSIAEDVNDRSDISPSDDAQTDAPDIDALQETLRLTPNLAPATQATQETRDVTGQLIPDEIKAYGPAAVLEYLKLLVQREKNKERVPDRSFSSFQSQSQRPQASGSNPLTTHQEGGIPGNPWFHNRSVEVRGYTVHTFSIRYKDEHVHRLR